jgi:hypothetical protein
MHSPRDATAATSRARCASYCGTSAEDFNIAFSFPFTTHPSRSLHHQSFVPSRNSLWLSDKEPSQLYPADHRFAQPTPRHALQTSSRLRERLFATEPSIAPPSHSSSPNHSQWLRNSYVCPLRMPARCVAYQTACCATTSRPDEAAQTNPC